LRHSAPESGDATAPAAGAFSQVATELSKSVAAEISGSGALAYGALGITGQDGMIADVSRITSRAAHARSPSG
jgi:hypothetical protein